MLQLSLAQLAPLQLLEDDLRFEDAEEDGEEAPGANHAPPPPPPPPPRQVGTLAAHARPCAPSAVTRHLPVTPVLLLTIPR
jgi:hypothetical protein